ncbi:MAG: tryptophan--tRNA ligase [Bdellovibrionota bacterium]
MKTIVSGMRPTGSLHIGHYFGALKNWIDLQHHNQCYFTVVDWHALTSEFEDTRNIPAHTREMVADWLASGLDPNLCTIFLQSGVDAQSVLYLILGMFTPIGWLERNPTYKEQKEQIQHRDLSNLGFFAYPVLQTADILLYKGEKVPVGVDQVPHIELSREIARRFNRIAGEIFPEPEALLTPSPKISGTDGRKMSKSYGNAISLGEPSQELEKKVKAMVTDPNRIRRSDPGDPKQCNLFPLHELLSSKETQEEVIQGCTTAGIGCVDCKKMLLPSLEA